MDRRSPLLLVLVLVALAGTVGVAIHLTSRSAGDGAEGVGTSAAEAAERSAAETPQAETDADLAPVAADEESRERAPEAAPDPELAALTTTLEGVVVSPSGTPADERVLVLALSSEMPPRRLYRAGGPADAAWAGDRARELLGAAEAAADGAFSLMLPEDTAVVHLALAGRYLRSRATTRVELPDTGARLSGALGAWVTGRLTAPDGSADGVEGVHVELGPDITAGFEATAMREVAQAHETETDADGRFELRGVSPEIAHGLVVQPADLAAHLELGIELAPGEHADFAVPLRAGARASGRVVDEAGAPVAGAAVELRFPGLVGDMVGELRSTESDETGGFTLDGIPPERELDLHASHAEHRAGRLRFESVREGGATEGLEVALVRGAALSGTVRFPDGTPAAGASVRVSPDPSQLQGMNAARIARIDDRRTETDAEGRFAVAGLEDVLFRVRARVEVEDAEDPHAGEWRATASEVAPDGSPVELVLETLHVLSGRVTDLDGVPLGAFTVMATLRGSGAMFGIGAEQGAWPFEDAEDGAFEVPQALSSGVWEVRVDAAGYAASETVEVTLPREPGADPLLFALGPAAGVAGTVLDASDVPVSGAKVTLDLALADRMAWMQRGGPPSATTDADGRFRLLDLEPGSIAVVASLDGWASSAPVSREVRPGAVAEDLVLRLRVGGTLTGEILDDEGAPAEGLRVIVQLTPSYSVQHMLRSDREGRFRVEHLEPGQWQVVATADFLGDGDLAEEGGMGEMLASMKMDFVEIVDGETTHVVLGAVPADPVHVTGRVRHDGEPVTGAIVTVVPASSDGPGALKMKITDDDGAFEIDLDGPGPHLFTVQMAADMGRQNSVEFLETIPDAREHALVLDLPLGRISGRVRGADGEPLAECRVSLTVEGGITPASFLGGHYTETATDAEGAYDIPCLSPGIYTVSAGGAMLGGLLGDDSTGGRVVRGGVVVEEGAWIDGVDFRLEAPGELRGTVVDETGAPVSGAAIFLRDAESRLLERFSLVTTDGGGRFVYRGLAPGEYTASARTGDRAAAPGEPVRVDSGAVAETRIVAVPGTTLKITVSDAVDLALRARVSVLDEDGRQVAGLRTMEEITQIFSRSGGEDDDAQQVGPLPPGRYRVIATLPDGRTDEKRVTLTGRPERRVRLRFD